MGSVARFLDRIIRLSDADPRQTCIAKKVLGWPKRCKLAHALPWEYSYKRLQLAQLLGQLGVFLTWCTPVVPNSRPRAAGLPPATLRQDENQG